MMIVLGAALLFLFVFVDTMYECFINPLGVYGYDYVGDTEKSSE